MRFLLDVITVACARYLTMQQKWQIGSVKSQQPANQIYPQPERARAWGSTQEMDKGKERSCRCSPSTHGEQSEEDSGQIYNELLALHWWHSSFRY